MNSTTASIAALLALLVSATQVSSIAHADKKDTTSTKTTTASEPEKSETDNGLKSIEQGFSIPAADGTSSKNDTQKKGADKK